MFGEIGVAAPFSLPYWKSYEHRLKLKKKTLKTLPIFVLKDRFYYDQLIVKGIKYGKAFIRIITHGIPQMRIWISNSE